MVYSDSFSGSGKIKAPIKPTTQPGQNPKPPEVHVGRVHVGLTSPEVGPHGGMSREDIPYGKIGGIQLFSKRCFLAVILRIGLLQRVVIKVM